MPSIPIVFTTPEDSCFLDKLEERIKNDAGVKHPELLLEYPAVYIHYWPTDKVSYPDRSGKLVERQKFDVYVGESIDVVQRTRQHYDDGRSDPDSWQASMLNSNAEPHFIAIGHEHFNKSFTMDVENRLIEYVLAMQSSVRKPLNKRGNPQGSYYPSSEFDAVFSQIWRRLRGLKKDLFLSESAIKDSALFKASPLKKLTPEQIRAKDAIISKIREAYYTGKDGQLIIVQGEAGTGKTVLTTSTFYDLLTQNMDSESDNVESLDCYLMVNHDQQAQVYDSMVRRLDLGEDIASKPSHFITTHSPQAKVDVAFIDEGHLLWTQGTQGYSGKNQLADIMERSKVTVLMFDEYQVLNAEEYWEPKLLEHYKHLSKEQGNFIELKTQLRMQCSESTKQWLDAFVLNRTIGKFTADSKYDVRVFDSPEKLHEAISKLASDEESKLSRVVATYDWAYNGAGRPDDGGFWEVQIGKWHLPWNYELKRTLNSKQSKAIKGLAWAEQPQTINEVGSTYTIQGFDLSYVGVILGPSVKYVDGKIVFDPSCSKNHKATRNRTLSDNTKVSFGETFIRNEVKVLLSRGVKGLYIYACDPALRKALHDIAVL